MTKEKYDINDIKKIIKNYESLGQEKFDISDVQRLLNHNLLMKEGIKSYRFNNTNIGEITKELTKEMVNFVNLEKNLCKIYVIFDILDDMIKDSKEQIIINFIKNARSNKSESQ